MIQSLLFGKKSLKDTSLMSTLASAVGIAAPETGRALLLNASYNPTYWMYQDFDRAFATHWEQKTGKAVTLMQSNGASGKQAWAVAHDDLEADIVTLALAPDIESIQRAGLIDKAWQTRLPYNSSPYTSTIVFLVRKGNPKQIRDWDDLTRSDVSVIAPNPKVSGGARWMYLTAWGYELARTGGDQTRAREFTHRLYKNATVLTPPDRGLTLPFVEQNLGDVLIAWENEAYIAVNDLSQDQFEVVTPSISILAEPVVAVVDRVVDRNGTRALAQAYLEYLYSEEGQEIVARHYYRSRLESVAAKYADRPKMNLFTVNEVFGGWQKAQSVHFAEGGIFDQMGLVCMWYER